MTNKSINRNKADANNGNSNVHRCWRVADGENEYELICINRAQSRDLDIALCTWVNYNYLENDLCNGAHHIVCNMHKSTYVCARRRRHGRSIDIDLSRFRENILSYDALCAASPLVQHQTYIFKVSISIITAKRPPQIVNSNDAHWQVCARARLLSFLVWNLTRLSHVRTYVSDICFETLKPLARRIINESECYASTRSVNSLST